MIRLGIACNVEILSDQCSFQVDIDHMIEIRTEDQEELQEYTVPTLRHRVLS
jgi:hypothetical protein